MTIAKARKVLGKLAEGLSNEDLEKELETHNFLMELLFHPSSTFTGTSGKLT